MEKNRTRKEPKEAVCISMAKKDVDLSADLDILSYCFADQVRARMEKRAPSEKLKKRMLEVLARVNERLADDEYIHFKLEVCKDSLKNGNGALFGEVRAVIVSYPPLKG